MIKLQNEGDEMQNEGDGMQNWWQAGIRMVMLPTLSFHHQLLDYCLQAKKWLCLICLSQTVSVACISIYCESLDLQWISEFRWVDLCFVLWYRSRFRPHNIMKPAVLIFSSVVVVLITLQDLMPQNLISRNPKRSLITWTINTFNLCVRWHFILLLIDWTMPLKMARIFACWWAYIGMCVQLCRWKSYRRWGRSHAHCGESPMKYVRLTTSCLALFILPRLATGSALEFVYLPKLPIYFGELIFHILNLQPEEFAWDVEFGNEIILKLQKWWDIF